MNHQERIIPIAVPIFSWATIELVLTNDVPASEVKRGEIDSHKNRACTITDDGKIMLILRNDFTPCELAHEAVHVAGYILRKSGVRVSLSNDECLAYVVDWVVSSVTEKSC